MGLDKEDRKQRYEELMEIYWGIWRRRLEFVTDRKNFIKIFRYKINQEPYRSSRPDANPISKPNQEWEPEYNQHRRPDYLWNELMDR